MPQPNRSARGAITALTRNCWPTLAVVTGGSLAILSAGFACLWLRIVHPAAGPIAVLAALVLIGCGALQLRILWLALLKRQIPAALPIARALQPLGWLAGVALVSLLIVLAVGPLPSIGWAWLATMAVAQTLLLLPLAASPKIAEDWRRWTQGHTSRRLTWLVYACVAVVVGGELALRAQRAILDAGWLAPAAPVEDGSLARVVDSDEPVDLGVGWLTSGRFRVAIVGDEAACDRAPDGYLARIEHIVPGVEIVSLSSNWAELSPAELNAELATTRPDLVLAVMSVCDEVSRAEATSSWFDYRRYELARRLFDTAEPRPERPSDIRAEDLESFLRAIGPQLAACRTPIDPSMRSRWQRTFGLVERMRAGCQRAGVPLAMVLVPGEFQLNDRLCQTLLKRNGLSSERFDVELPQRRLAGFAEHRQLPVVDLLPHLKRCGQSVYERHASVLNEQGQSAAAAAIGGWIESRYGAQVAAQLSVTP